MAAGEICGLAARTFADQETKVRKFVVLAVVALAGAALLWFFGGMLMNWLRALHA